jgi:hypothetical protein
MDMRERGTIWTNVGYQSMPIVIHPNDEYIRVFPDGPYDQAWQGVQKVDPIADVDTTYMEIPNPYYNEMELLPRVQYVNPTSVSVGAGPAVIEGWEEQDELAMAGSQPGLLATIMSRLRGQ